MKPDYTFIVNLNHQSDILFEPPLLTYWIFITSEGRWDSKFTIFSDETFTTYVLLAAESETHYFNDETFAMHVFLVVESELIYVSLLSPLMWIFVTNEGGKIQD